MSHITIVINAVSPTPVSTAADSLTSFTTPPYSVSVNYVPEDTMTPAQIGQEVARIQRHVNQIIGKPAD